MVSSITNGADCSICHRTLGEGLVTQLNCGHEFHRSCIDPWICACRNASRPPTCPLDRGRIRTINDNPSANPPGRRVVIDRLFLKIIYIRTSIHRVGSDSDQRVQEILDELLSNISSTRREVSGHREEMQRLAGSFIEAYRIPLPESRRSDMTPSLTLSLKRVVEKVIEWLSLVYSEIKRRVLELSGASLVNPEAPQREDPLSPVERRLAVLYNEGRAFNNHTYDIII